jgi:hypothetical protein
MFVRIHPRQFTFFVGPLFMGLLLLAGVVGSTGSAAETPDKKQEKRNLPAAVAADKAATEAKRAHVQATELVPMLHAPPMAQVEAKPPSPVAGRVWVPGHWVPEKGEWRWTKGEWRLPPTPISVWIEPRYDAKTKQWSAGYWQPDRPDSYEGETAQAAATPPVSESAW